MRYLHLTLCLFLSLPSLAQQDIKLKEYTYAEFFQLIEDERDTVFRLNNAIISFDERTDQRFKVAIRTGDSKDSTFQRRNDIIVHKRLELENVIFKKDLITENGRPFVAGAIYDIHFKKDVILLNTSNLFISYSIFDGILEYTLQDCSAFKDIVEVFNLFYVEFSTFSEFDFYKFCQGQSYSFGVYLNGNTIESADPKGSSSISNYENSILSLTNNHIKAQNFLSIRNHRGAGAFEFKNNDLEGSLILLEDQNTQGNLLWSNNSFSNPINLAISALGVNDEVEWSQFKDQVKSLNAFADFSQEYNGRFPAQQPMEYRAKLDSLYYDSVRYHNENIFAKEIGLKGNFYTYYKNKYNTAVANEVYLELKDFETERLKVLYEQNKTFDSFFKWKINQFLKLFAAYGTEPAKAITFSVYVIIVFALVYLFFPNHWDSHGKDRILHRYQFFFKYLNKDAGMHDVYLEGKKDELAHYEGFKSFFIENGKHVPKFFLATALPLYRWSIASTRTSSWLLSKIDIFRGKWSDLPAPKRAVKTMVLSIAFLLALTYDVCIKVLNALMLSINTFTTLGFGEIPIKGLPRYLAIIQGFIGWFMLTIFSVSLISQLLN